MLISKSIIMPKVKIQFPKTEMDAIRLGAG
jgi:hypothetical protein